MIWVIISILVIVLAIFIAKKLRKSADPQCHKCKRPIPLKNNASLLVRLMYQGDDLEDETVHELEPHRHLFRVQKGRKELCEGSPSLAQYLPGQPRDAREGSQYSFSLASRVRAAHEQMKELAG